MSALDAKIDDLYQLPLSAFTGARNALAKTVSGADAARVKALAKPTIIPWVMNQVYWRSRATFDRVMKSGAALRAAQIAALEGREADVRAAGDAHRRAIADASADAMRRASAVGAKPDADALARALEALSLATNPPASPGRLTEAIEPAGLEALTGLAGLKLKTEHLELRTPNARTLEPRTLEPRSAARIEAARKKHETAVQEAEALVARAEMKERSSRESWERCHDELLAARQALAGLRRDKPPG